MISRDITHQSEWIGVLNEMYSGKEKEEIPGLNLSQIVSFAKELPDESFYQVMQLYNHNLYATEAQKRYPQEELSPRTLNMLETLIQADLSIERSVYIFFNSKLREVVQLGCLIDELIGIGKSKSEIITVVRNYWIAGEIRYIQEDGLVRVVAQSISSARLMVFRSDLTHINGASGEWINPEVGMNVYFKIKDYLDDGGQFQIDYLCEELPVL